MKYSVILDNPVFRGIAEEELPELLEFLDTKEKSFGRDDTVFHLGDRTEQMGLVLSGGVNIFRTDLWGRRSILDHVNPGEVFGETYACLGDMPLMVDVAASEESDILFLKIGRITRIQPESGSPRFRLMQNLFHIMAEKNLNLSRKINHITPKSIRGRIVSYLSYEAVRQKSPSFEIPFNRQQMADYLLVDRSALSAELSRMQKEGLLTFRRNRFRLHTELDADHKSM
ncbi:MAG TPA: Crp/Fnr family transcriptional regulator [Candidatus Mediterraneibacter norfolkensis]|nr:Crp/Fnr family transcriptional regulator [Candidatus Mediterraneibacter norfolkensis]